MAETPEFIAGSGLLAEVYEYARDAHHGPSRRGSTDIDHPLLVAELLAGRGFDEELIAAALLHDVLEDTTKTTDEIAARFGAEVDELVEVMTEDPKLEPYARRKAEHRSRVLERGSRTATIYLADKLARARRYAAEGGGVAPERLDHYRATLAEFRASGLDLPFLEDLEAALSQLHPSAEEDAKGAPA